MTSTPGQEAQFHTVFGVFLFTVNLLCTSCLLILSGKQRFFVGGLFCFVVFFLQWMRNTQSTANLYPLHHIAHCLSIQTFLFAFIFIRQFTPEGINGKALKITRRDDVKNEKSFWNCNWSKPGCNFRHAVITRCALLFKWAYDNNETEKKNIYFKWS